MIAEEKIKYNYRGMVLPEKVIARIKACDYGFVHTQKLGYHFSYETDTFQFHVVDRFASFPLFYCIKDGKPYVSENIEELIPKLDRVKLDPVGYYTTGWLFKGERTELTPIEGIKRIMPGHYLEYKNEHINIIQYWSFLDLNDKPFEGTIDDAAEKLGFLIRQAIKRCYDFDKNCALQLSGGIDSGVIASLYAGFSNNDVQAYLFKQKDDPMADDTESGFVKRYQSHYPNIKLKSFDFVKPSTDFEYSVGNWWAIQSNSHDENQISHASKNGHKFILTGLGGDELASYKISSKTKKFISNDKLAMKLFNFQNRLSIRIKEIIKILIGREGNPIYALKMYSPQNFFSDRGFWYTKDFYKVNKHFMTRPPMTPEFYPSTFAYRLEVLSRSWFTIRSDRWNYLGAKYRIDFIHPLLDADLVSFVACIPSELLMSLGKRELFKKALEKYIPSQLMEGVKRSLYRTETTNLELLENQLKSLLAKTDHFEHSIAVSIFDIHILRKQIKQSLRKLYLVKKYKKYKETTVLQIQISIYNTIIRNCQYLQALENNQLQFKCRPYNIEPVPLLENKLNKV